MRVSKEQYDSAVTRESKRDRRSTALGLTALASTVGWFPIGLAISFLTLGGPDIPKYAFAIDAAIGTLSLVGLGLNKMSRRQDRETIKEWHIENPEPDGYTGWM